MNAGTCISNACHEPGRKGQRTSKKGNKDYARTTLRTVRIALDVVIEDLLGHMDVNALERKAR